MPLVEDVESHPPADPPAKNAVSITARLERDDSGIDIVPDGGPTSPSHLSGTSGCKSMSSPLKQVTMAKLVVYIFVCCATAVVIFSVVFFGTNKELGVDAQFEDTNGTYIWKPPLGNKNGLNLIVENALDDRWTPYFDEYTAVWDNREPDALTLTTRRVATDSSCAPSFGRLKVCNGNYGLTNWKGVNMNLVRNGFIVFGICKMNDYFLDKASDVDKKYTM
jgi:hypothetical protein